MQLLATAGAVADRSWTDRPVGTYDVLLDDELAVWIRGPADAEAYVVGEISNLSTEVADRPWLGGAVDVHHDLAVHGFIVHRHVRPR